MRPSKTNFEIISNVVVVVVVVVKEKDTRYCGRIFISLLKSKSLEDTASILPEFWTDPIELTETEK